MSSSLESLLAASGPSLGGVLSSVDCGPSGRLGDDYRELLHRRNGFFAYVSALQVFPCDATVANGVANWNSGTSWRAAYGDLAEGHWFFAQDLFGVQFSIYDERIVTFEPETGEITSVASSINEWAEYVVQDPEVRVGASMANAWQKMNGPLPDGHRLRPRIPFIAGGKYAVEELYDLETKTLLDFTASIAIQVKDLPDGTLIEIEVGD